MSAKEKQARLCVRSAQRALAKLGRLVLQETPFGGQVYNRLDATIQYNKIKEQLDSADLLLKPRRKPT